MALSLRNAFGLDGPAPLAQEPFFSPDGSAFGSQWTTRTANGGTATIQGGRGRLSPGTTDYADGVATYLNALSSSSTDVVFDVAFATLTEQYLTVRLRSNSPTSTTNYTAGYFLQIFPGNGANSMGVSVQLASGATTGLSGDIAAGAFTANVAKRIRFRVTTINGGTINQYSVRVWDPASSEPTSWTYQNTDTTGTYTAGTLVFDYQPGSGHPSGQFAYLDNILVTDPALTNPAYTGASGFAGSGALSLPGGGAFTGPLTQWQSALSTVASAPAKVLAVGGSFVEGQGASARLNRWWDKFRLSLQTNYASGAVGGDGYLPAFYSVYASDSTWGEWRTATSGTVTNDVSVPSLGMHTAVMSAGASRTYTFTGTDLDIWYSGRSDAGAFTWKIDSGSATSVTAPTTSSVNNRVQVTGLTAGSHTVTIAATGKTYLQGFTVFNGDRNKGVQTYDNGHVGWETSQFLAQDSTWDALLNTIGPDLVILTDNSLNDASDGKSIATVQADTQTLITRIKALTKAPSILLIADYQPATNTNPAWSGYVSMLSALASTNNIGFLDISAVMGPATTSGLYSSDGLHPSNTGHTAYAGYVTSSASTVTTTPGSGTPKPISAASFTGSGTLTASGVATQTVALTGTAAFSGSGTLTTASTPSSPGTGALSGSGTLTSSAIPSATGSAPLSGSGTLSTTAAATTTGTATLTGSGVLSAAGAATTSSAASFSGSGALASTAIPSSSGTATLTGSGTLATAGKPSATGSATLSGSGTLTTTSALAVTGSAAFTGAGTLTATQTAQSTVTSATFTGSGTLSSTAAPTITGTATLTGAGTLSSTQGAISTTGSASFTGTGTLTTAAIFSAQGTASFAGTGVLSSTPIPQVLSTAALSGSGTLTSAAVARLTGTATLSGSGVLTTTAIASARGTANLTGSGTLTSTPIPRPISSATFTGTGTLDASGSIAPTGTADFSGAGWLMSMSAQGATANADLSGTGTLTATPTAVTTTDTATLSGSGTLTAAGTVNAVRTAAFSSTGTLSTAAKLATSGTATFTGSGTLTSTSASISAGTGDLSGNGDLEPYNWLGPVLTATGTPLFAASPLGTGYVPNGGQYATTADYGNGGVPGAVIYTVELWAQVTASGTARMFFSTGTTTVNSNRLQLGVTTGNVLQLVLGTYVAPVGTALSQGYHHFAVTLVNGRYRVYVDGVQVFTLSGASTVFTWAGGFTVGRNASGAQQWVGGIDELRISRSDRYPAGTTFTVPSSAFTPDTNTVALYHFDSDGNPAMGGVAFPSILGTADFSSEGSLVTMSGGNSSDTADFSGDSDLDANGTVAISTAIDLSGTGALASTATPKFARSISLSGSGALSTSAIVRFTGTAAFTGSGTLVASGAPAPTGSGALSSTGTLSSSSAQASAGTAALSGSGTLTATGSEASTQSAAFTGAGVLVATATQVTFTGTAALTGTGALTILTILQIVATAAFTGSGTLTATGAAMQPAVDSFAEIDDVYLTPVSATIVGALFGILDIETGITQMSARGSSISLEVFRNPVDATAEM